MEHAWWVSERTIEFTGRRPRRFDVEDGPEFGHSGALPRARPAPTREAGSVRTVAYVARAASTVRPIGLEALPVPGDW